MKVFDLICTLTHFDPYCEVMILDKSGDAVQFTESNLGWNGTCGDSDKAKDNRYKSTELYITIDKEIEN